MEISVAKQKLKLRSIITTRDDIYSTTFQLYHEWEDVFQRTSICLLSRILFKI